MQLQTFIAFTLLLSGLASAATLPRANEAAECVPIGQYCNPHIGRHCCEGRCIPGRPGGVSVAIHTVLVLLFIQIWRIDLPSVIDGLLAPARKLSYQGQIKFPPAIANSYFVSRSWLSFAFAS